MSLEQYALLVSCPWLAHVHTIQQLRFDQVFFWQSSHGTDFSRTMCPSCPVAHVPGHKPKPRWLKQFNDVVKTDESEFFLQENYLKSSGARRRIFSVIFFLISQSSQHLLCTRLSLETSNLKDIGKILEGDNAPEKELKTCV